MKIKRFIGSDMREAIRNVRNALGEDAVILSNSRTAQGVEVVAAVDYDESLLSINDANKVVTQSEQKQFDEQTVNRDAIWDDVRYGRNIPETDRQTSAKSNKNRDVQIYSKHPQEDWRYI